MVNDWFNPDRLRRIGHTPDYRFSLANERTFLAWLRTGLALIAGGLAVAQFLPELQVTFLREAIAIALLIGGATVALRGLNHWVRSERAIRLGQDLPQSRFPALLTLSLVTGALVLVAVVVVEGLGP